MQWLSSTKVEKSNVESAKGVGINRSPVWKIVKKFQKIGNRLDRPEHGRKRSVRSPQLLKQHEGKAATKLSPKLWKPWPPHPVWANPPWTRCWGTIWGWSYSRCCTARSLRPIMWAWGPKNAGKSSRKWPTTRCQTSCSRTRRNSSSIERSIVTRLQNPQSVMVSAAVKKRARGPLCFFCPLESNRTPSAASPTFWRVACCPGPRSISKQCPGPCNRTLCPLMSPRLPSPGFRENSPHS